MSDSRSFDVIVVGGGHAGTEAALAAARAGAETLLLTHNIETIGQMSCNPAIGGIGKGHLVKEIDALGGVMARAADRAGIHFRILNRRKGPAVRATRAQADRVLYRRAIRRMVESQENLSLFQQAVNDLIVKDGRVTGVVTQMGLEFRARAVVLTVGTFLGGKIHIGESNHTGGRAGDPPANALALRLRELPFNVGRLKTGTPPRIDGRTIDYSRLEEQPGDNPTPVFSFMGHIDEHPRQVSCHITRTNASTHEIIRAALHRSPMYSGAIESTGPRYCPSIEDKIVRFADKTSHQIFIEPEGLDTPEVYPNGISTSLPFDVQYDLVRSIAGFENAHITRPGYAIEYDFFDPRGLRPSLETKYIDDLFFAGQINGTTGYEEAAAQGLVAGLNAARRVQEKEAWSPRRDEAYIGVLIDDLITRGTAEPYRMFTSRAEYRLLLREDNADLRLTSIGHELGVVENARRRSFEAKRQAIEREQARLAALKLRLSREQIPPDPPLSKGGDKFSPPLRKGGAGGILSDGGGRSMGEAIPALELLRRPEMSYEALMSLPGAGPGVIDPRVAEQVEIQAKYAGYVDRQQQEIERARRHQETGLPVDLDYAQVHGLSTEARHKLVQVRPATIGQAARIPGVTPAAVSILLVHLKKRAWREKKIA